ncbi:MAG: hypothetical protein V3S69_00260 [Dehalococcoidales bacterium]
MISTKLSTVSTLLENGNTPLPYPEKANDCDLEGVFEPTDEYLAWRSQFPVGYLLAKQIEGNKTKIIGIADKAVYDYESKHIADPADYIGTRPDNQIRWKV